MTIQIKEVSYSDGTIGEQVEITTEDGSMTVMTKTHYEAQQAQQLTGIPVV